MRAQALIATACVALLSACDPGVYHGGAPPGPPSITIVSPTAGAQVMFGADKLVPVSFSVGGFNLKMAGTCVAADGACGHVHLRLDGNACNNTAAGKQYNTSGFASPIDANLGLCPTAEGTHSVTLELHNNDHTPVMSGGLPVLANESFVAHTGSAALPAITITSPAPNTTVVMPADQTLPVDFTVANFTLKMPGTCVAADGACGHIHLKVDGDVCNNVAAAKPYNTNGFASPTVALLGLCPMPVGMHTITTELHNDDHTPVTNQGTTVSASVAITTQ